MVSYRTLQQLIVEKVSNLVQSHGLQFWESAKKIFQMQRLVLHPCYLQVIHLILLKQQFILCAAFPGAVLEHREPAMSRPSSGQMPPVNPNSTNPITIPGAEKQSHTPHEASPTNELEETANIAESLGNIGKQQKLSFKLY